MVFHLPNRSQIPESAIQPTPVLSRWQSKHLRNLWWEALLDVLHIVGVFQLRGILDVGNIEKYTGHILALGFDINIDFS